MTGVERTLAVSESKRFDRVPLALIVHLHHLASRWSLYNG